MWETIELKATLTPPFYSEGLKSPPDERKEGDNNVCYISGFNPDWNIYCSPYRIVLYNL